jgi:hypothetical protein
VSSPPFARFVAIDWSGASLPSYQRRAIVRCVIEGPPANRRVTSLEWGLDRDETVSWLAERASERIRTLVGMDFPFAYAAPFLDHLQVPDFPALLTRMAGLDGAEAASLFEEFVTMCGQWWADRRGDARRQVERLETTVNVESPLRALPRNGRYEFIGPRQVGKGAIRGIAAIARLKRRAPSVRVWPFEDPGTAPLVLAEIWPRLALGAVRKRKLAEREQFVQTLLPRAVELPPELMCKAAASDHTIDALAAAVSMALGEWPLFDRHALPPGSAREGWILGVAPTSPKPAT